MTADDRPPKPRPTKARVIIDWIVGISLLVLGVVGLFLPILQGVVLMVAGLAVLSSHSKWARAIFERVKGAGRNVKQKIQERRSERKRERAADGSRRDRQ
jgi:uncharacterized membrane protein YbaN (DUF454 family)